MLFVCLSVRLVGWSGVGVFGLDARGSVWKCEARWCDALLRVGVCGWFCWRLIVGLVARPVA